LEKISEETDQSLSEVIRRALALYDLIGSRLKAGGKLVLSNADGECEIVLTEFVD